MTKVGKTNQTALFYFGILLCWQEEHMFKAVCNLDAKDFS